MATAIAPLSQETTKPLEDPLAHLPCSTIIGYRKAETIYGGRRTSAGLYLVVEGKVRVSRTTSEGRQVIVDIYRPDEIFGESAFIGEPERTEVAVALEDTRVMTWAINAIEELAERRPQLGMALIQLLVRRSMEFGSRIESFSLDGIGQRLARALIRFSERMGEETEDGSVQMIPFTHEFLAQYVGTSRESVNAYMVQFRRRGYLGYSRKRIRLYPHAIENWLREESETA